MILTLIILTLCCSILSYIEYSKKIDMILPNCYIWFDIFKDPGVLAWLLLYLANLFSFGLLVGSLF